MQSNFTKIYQNLLLLLIYMDLGVMCQLSQRWRHAKIYTLCLHYGSSCSFRTYIHTVIVAYCLPPTPPPHLPSPTHITTLNLTSMLWIVGTTAVHIFIVQTETANHGQGRWSKVRAYTWQRQDGNGAVGSRLSAETVLVSSFCINLFTEHDHLNQIKFHQFCTSGGFFSWRVLGWYLRDCY